MSSNDNNTLNEENPVGSKDKKLKKKNIQSNSNENENENVAIDINDKTTNGGIPTIDYNVTINLPDNFKSKKQFVIFKNQLEAFVNNNLFYY